MTGRVRPTVAAFAVGVSLALAGELAVGLLLYASDGFLRALTAVLAAGLGALGLGLATAPGRNAEGLAAALRRRWLLAVAVFGAAAVVALGWSLAPDASATSWQRGVGLAVLCVLPLYAGGVLLGALAAAHPHVRVGAAAVLGAALGIVLQGAVLLSSVEPVSVYLLGVVLLSSAALVESGSAHEVDDAVAPEPESGTGDESSTVVAPEPGSGGLSE